MGAILAAVYNKFLGRTGANRWLPPAAAVCKVVLYRVALLEQDCNAIL